MRKTTRRAPNPAPPRTRHRHGRGEEVGVADLVLPAAVAPAVAAVAIDQ